MVPAHAVADLAGGGIANEIFAGAGRRHGAVAVAGIGTCADQRRITDTAPLLARQATGRSGGCQVTVVVERHGTDRSVHMRRVNHGCMVFLPILEHLLAFRGVEIGRIDLLQSLRFRERIGALAGHQDVARMIHDGARRLDRILGGGQGGNGTSLERTAVHDGGVEIGIAVCGDGRALAGIEQRIVFQRDQGRFDGIGGRAALIKHGLASRQGFGQAGAVGSFLFRCQVAAIDDARAAVDGQGPVFLLAEDAVDDVIGAVEGRLADFERLDVESAPRADAGHLDIGHVERLARRQVVDLAALDQPGMAVRDAVEMGRAVAFDGHGRGFVDSQTGQRRGVALAIRVAQAFRLDDKGEQPAEALTRIEMAVGDDMAHQRRMDEIAFDGDRRAHRVGHGLGRGDATAVHGAVEP